MCSSMHATNMYNLSNTGTVQLELEEEEDVEILG
jgi:hypothetical protein